MSSKSVHPSRNRTLPTKTRIAIAISAAIAIPAQAFAAEIVLPRIDVVGQGDEAIGK